MQQGGVWRFEWTLVYIPRLVWLLHGEGNEGTLNFYGKDLTDERTIDWLERLRSCFGSQT